jgi:hypothetical protein
MKIKPEKPKVVGHSPRASAADIIKSFVRRHGDVVLYLEAILADAFKLLEHYRLADYSRDVATLRRRYVSEGLSFATKTLPNLFTEFLIGLEGGKPSYPGFKLDRDQTHPVFLRQLFDMASKCDDVDKVTAMKCLYQFCCAFKKLKGPYRPSTLQKQLWSFVETDIDLKYLEFDSQECERIIVSARNVITRVLGDLSPEFDTGLFVPRPGPGATNTPRRKNVRYRPHVLYKQLDEVFPYEDWFYSHPWDLRTDPKKYLSLGSCERPSSRFKFVDKTYAKPRGICIEELETQFLQQGIKRALYAKIGSHPLTRGRINFEDQGVNGRLAATSSYDRKYGTIDMSEASDRISRRLVKTLFRGTPELLEALLSVSTRTIELPEDIPFIRDFPCEKFAPMGSAVCFPIMSLVHFVLIRGILTMCGYPPSLAHDIYVYGDDILVRSECVEDVYKWLPLFGMKLNTEKSYFKSHFRESCGVHAYHGVDITPVYFKYIPTPQSHWGEVLSIRGVERDLFYRGFRNTAALLRSLSQKVKKLRGVKPLFVSPKSKVFGWIRNTEDAPRRPYSGLPRRWEGKTYSQQFLYKTLVVRPLSDDLSIEDQSECYLKWLTEHPNPVARIDEESKRLQVPTPTIPVFFDEYGPTSTFRVHVSDLRLSAYRRRRVANGYASQQLGVDVATQSVMESRSDFIIRREWCPDSAF